jgi:hypothetical protein
MAFRLINRRDPYQFEIGDECAHAKEGAQRVIKELINRGLAVKQKALNGRNIISLPPKFALEEQRTILLDTAVHCILRLTEKVPTNAENMRRRIVEVRELLRDALRTVSAINKGFLPSKNKLPKPLTREVLKKLLSEGPISNLIHREDNHDNEREEGPTNNGMLDLSEE